MCPSLIQIGSKMAEKNCTNKQTNRQTDTMKIMVIGREPIKCQEINSQYQSKNTSYFNHNYLMVKGYRYSHLTWTDSSNNGGTLIIVSPRSKYWGRVPLSNRDRRPCRLSITRMSCRWQIRATQCITANVLQTSKVNSRCYKLATDRS